MTIVYGSDLEVSFTLRENDSRRMDHTLVTPNFDMDTKQDENSEFLLTFWILTVPVILLVLLNIFANGMILVIFIKTKCLRRCRNIYILSLTLADLFSGIIMPTSIFEVLFGKDWTLEPILYHLFIMVRYSLLFASLLSILLLTVDRWWSINYPFSYRVKRSRKISILIVVTCWILSFVFHVPILVSGSSGYERNDTNSIVFSTVSYSFNHDHNLIFSVCISVVENLFPILSLLSLTIAIYIKLFKRRNTKKIRRSMSITERHIIKKGFIESNNSSVTSNDSEDTGRQAIVVQQHRKCSLYRFLKPSVITFVLDSPDNRRRSSDSSTYINGIKTKFFNKGETKLLRSRKQSDDIVKDFLVRQDKKAILSLGLLAVTSFICRMPYVVVTLYHTTSRDTVPSWIMILSFLALVANSSINPFLYGFGNSDFRRILKTWISCTSINGVKYRNPWNSINQNSRELRLVQEYS